MSILKNANQRLLSAKITQDNDDMIYLINSLFGTSFDPLVYNYLGTPFNKNKIQKQYVRGMSPASCYKQLMKLLTKTNVYVDDSYYDADAAYAERFGINRFSYIISFNSSSTGTLVSLEIYLHNMSLDKWIGSKY